MLLLDVTPLAKEEYLFITRLLLLLSTLLQVSVYCWTWMRSAGVAHASCTTISFVRQNSRVATNHVTYPINRIFHPFSRLTRSHFSTTRYTMESNKNMDNEQIFSNTDNDRISRQHGLLMRQTQEKVQAHHAIATTVRIEEKQKNQNGVTTRKPLVVIIAGPTGSGKSDVAALLSSPDRATRILQEVVSSVESCCGHIVSADSVQAYQGVNVGANKPTLDERQATRYHLIDIVSSTDRQYNAADWMADAISVIEDLSAATWQKIIREKEDVSSRVDTSTTATPVLPIVVGGTMMYLQWLVHGRPDAPSASLNHVEMASQIIQEYQELGNDYGWHAALEKVCSFGSTFQARAEMLCGRDWYRLRRLIEVALATKDDGNTPNDKSIYTGERMDGLSTLGYDVRCFFLCPDDRMKHAHILDERCEQMLARGLFKETADLVLSGQLPDDSQVARAIGYRQALAYLRRKNPMANDTLAFDKFLGEFTAATRQYSKKQMQWFRREKEFLFVPVALSTAEKEERIESSAAIIMNLCLLPREEYDNELIEVDDEGIMSLSEKTKQMNGDQAKGMKVFIGRRHIFLDGSKELKKVLDEADECAARIQGIENLLPSS